MSEYLNATCKVCGKKYHHCMKCEQVGSWRAVACSPECWNIWVDVVRERIAAENAAAEAPKAVEEPVIETPVVSIEKTVEVVEPEIHEDLRPDEGANDADVSVSTEE